MHRRAELGEGDESTGSATEGRRQRVLYAVVDEGCPARFPRHGKRQLVKGIF